MWVEDVPDSPSNLVELFHLCTISLSQDVLTRETIIGLASVCGESSLCLGSL